MFIGDDTPFNDETDGPPIREFTDGTSNTLLVVKAGPETAAPWTKPGGIEFTGKDILESLGTIGEEFVAAMADGSVHTIDCTIDESILYHLIQLQDGNFIPDF